MFIINLLIKIISNFYSHHNNKILYKVLITKIFSDKNLIPSLWCNNPYHFNKNLDMVIICIICYAFSHIAMTLSAIEFEITSIIADKTVYILYHFIDWELQWKVLCWLCFLVKGYIVYTYVFCQFLYWIKPDRNSVYNSKFHILSSSLSLSFNIVITCSLQY